MMALVDPKPYITYRFTDTRCGWCVYSSNFNLPFDSIGSFNKLTRQRTKVTRDERAKKWS